MSTTTMSAAPLSLNHFLERAGTLFHKNTIITRLPDKSLVRHSYGDFYKRTRALASALQRLGIKKGDRVATLCWNHHAHLECYFGIPAAGGVMHTINLRLPPTDIAWIASDAQDRILIVDDILLPIYDQFKQNYSFEHVIVFPFTGNPPSPSYIDYENLLAREDPSKFTYAEHEETDPVSMCYTSGTTGRPKGVVYSHRSTVLHSLSVALPDSTAVSNLDTVLPVTPMFHANSWGIPYVAVMTGAKLVFPGPHLHAEDLLDLIQLEPPTLSLGVPTIWISLINIFNESLDPSSSNYQRWKLPSMRSMVGGSAAPESLIREFDKHGIWIVHGWGMTETSPVGTLSYARSEFVNASADTRYSRAAMAGTPVPLVDIRICDEAGRVLQRGNPEAGEIQIHGPFITASYYHDANPELFTEDGWFKTGDVGTIDIYGCLKITDRVKDLIKSGGEWISSVDLENALMTHPSILEACVIAMPDDKWGERPLAYMVSKNKNAPQKEELDNHLLKTGFAKWQLPDKYQIIDEVPKTSTGKFSKLTLRKNFSA